jgi:lysophospholipase L1-like esterase
VPRVDWIWLILSAVVTVTLTAGCGGTGSGRNAARLSRRQPAGAPWDSVAAALDEPHARTACRPVVYVGDSTSDGEVQADYVPDASSRLPAQLARVGVQETLPEVSGARSIVETWHGFPNAATVAGQHASAGFRGCWILALGTNDTADVAAGSNVGLPARIAHMMAIIGDQPVMWVNVTTLVGSGAYAEDGMHRWDQDLLAACPRYPLMRVFDWARKAKPQWFVPDGIHYTTDGYVARTRLIAQALVKAFPNYGSPSPSCLVR